MPSIIHTSAVKATASAGSTQVGAKASAAKAPRTRGHGEAAPAGEGGQPPGGAREHRDHAPGSCRLFGTGRQAPEAQALDPPRIGVDHLELDARGMADHLAARGHPAGEVEHETAERVDVLALFRRQHRADARLEVLDRGACVGDQRAVRPLDHVDLLDVVLVLDIAHDLLDHVLDGDETVDTAELVHHHRHVHARKTHLQQQIEHAHGGRDEQHLADDVAQAERRFRHVGQ